MLTDVQPAANLVNRGGEGISKMDDRVKALNRALIYVVQFAKSPLDDLDHVFDRVIAARALHGGPEDYLAAIKSALASEEQLSDLIPQDHPEVVIRSYLAAVQKRLEEQLARN
jgi:hypothetical protein